MLISEIINQRVGLLGFGREGLVTATILREAGHTDEIRIYADTVPENLPSYCRYVCREEIAQSLANVDVVIRSPGFSPSHPLRQLIDQAACRQTTATQIFLREARDAGVQVIGITASKGKSTTSTLVHACLLEAGQASILVGNIGQPALELLNKTLTEKPIVVMELSSYQCNDLMPGYAPSIASIGSLFPEHLDYHGTAQAYYDAKFNIARMQGTADRLVCQVDSWPRVQSLHLPQQIELVNSDDTLHFKDGWFYDGEQKLISDEGMLLPGLHNRANACIALALTRHFGVTHLHLQSVLRTFSGLPFRLQHEGQHSGIFWINDSISTAPEATAAALEAMGGKVFTLIAGGHERGYNPDTMVKAILAYGVAEVILLPDTGSLIANRLQQTSSTPNVHLVETLEEAVNLAHKLTPVGAMCLLSPGAPSYNAFSGFEARGREFRRCITAL